MSEYIGSRISLISKSDIRYVGSLHQINSEQSTVSLENVRSYGTEGRKSRPEDEIAPSDQVYEYIIFRGSDVKDLRIEQQPAKETKSSSVPSDPAILGARPRPDVAPQGPAPQGPAPAAPGFQQPGPAPAGHGFQQPGPPQPPFNNHFYGPPPPGSWGRGGGPGPGPGPGPAFGNMPYPPHPGWYPPQGFPPGPGGPGGPGPWNPNFPYPPNLAHTPMQPSQDQNQNARAPSAGTPGADTKQDPGAGTSGPKQSPPTESTQPPRTEPKSLGQGGPKPQGAGDSNAMPAKPTNDKNASRPTGQKNTSPGVESAPVGPKNTRVAPIIPAIPKPFPVPASISTATATTSKTSPGAAIQDATEAAKAAVALAMAKMETGNNASHAQPEPSVDNLTKRVDEMRVNAVRAGQPGRGRGRGGRSVAPKVEVPSADFDFAESNAKFNKEDLLKQAASTTPTTGDGASAPGGEVAEADSSEKPDDPQAYDKTRSFFDNISSEAKDRAGSGQRPGGREWRGEEQKKNMETFGQGSVDSGYRNYRGRGRGRGGSRGRGYQNRGGQRGRGQGAPPMSAVDQ